MEDFLCPVCGIVKKVKKYELLTRKTCSYKCRRELAYTKRICVVCGKEFKALNREVNRGKGKCCSLSCASKLGMVNRKRKEVRLCETCGKEFRVRPEQLRRGGKFGCFCSKKCYGKFISQNRSGENHYFWVPRVTKICCVCGDSFEVEQRKSKQPVCSKSCNAVLASKKNKYANSKIEVKLKEWLIGQSITFEFQKRVEKIVTVDFLILPNICLFADGDYWHNYPDGTDRDKVQDLDLKEKGYKVLRFWERDINNNFDMVTQSILESVS